MPIVRRRGVIALLFLALAAGVLGACGLAPTSAAPPGATSCGGSHAWPPIAYASVPPPPAGVTIGLTGPDDVTVHNASSQAWRFRIERWVDAICVGYVAEAPIDSGAITPGHLVEANIDPAEASGGGIDDVRIGVAVFAPDCDASCTDPPVGFGWLDVPVPLPS